MAEQIHNGSHRAEKTSLEIDQPWKNLSKKELEKQYSPSQWSKRFPGDKVIEEHVDITRKISARVRAKIPNRRDVPFGKRARAKLDVFGEDLANESYILVYVHGGYWQELEKDLSLYLAEPFYEQGIVTVVLGYTLAPEALLPEIIADIAEGVRWCCKLALERGSKGVVPMGWSAGGHLITEVLSAAQDSCAQRVKGIVTLAGVFDVRPLVPTYVNDVLKLDEKRAWDLSPLSKVELLAQNFPNLKVLIVYGENDSAEFKRQSEQYCEVLRFNNVDASSEQIPEVDHFDLVEKLSSPDYTLTLRIIDFIRSLASI